MAIVTGDLQPFYSAVAGSAGGALSGSGITSGVDNNVFPDASDSERVAGKVDYRKVYFKNVNATSPALQPVVYGRVLPVAATLSVGVGKNDAADTDPTQGNMTAFGAAARCALVSDGADVRVATVIGLDNAGTPAPVREDVVLTGAAEVLTVATFSKVWAVWLSATDGARTVVAKQGSGGTVRGTIGPDRIGCWLWLSGPGPAKAQGMKLPDLAAGSAYGIWERIAVAAGAPSQVPDNMVVRIEEGA